MHKQMRFFLLVLALLAISVSVAGGAKPFLGTWINVNPDTGGLTKLVIVQKGAGYTVRGFGKCHPTDCDWGIVNLHFLGYSVTDTDFQWGMATWDHGFKTTTLIINLEGDKMIAVTYDVFAPGDTRSNYRSTFLLKKS